MAHCRPGYVCLRGNSIIAFIAELDEDLLRSELPYSDTRGNPYQSRVDLILQHLFNHQTHHRGQLTTLLHQLGVDVGVTDLMVMMREQDIA